MQFMLILKQAIRVYKYNALDSDLLLPTAPTDLYCYCVMLVFQLLLQASGAHRKD